MRTLPIIIMVILFISSGCKKYNFSPSCEKPLFIKSYISVSQPEFLIRLSDTITLQYLIADFYTLDSISIGEYEKFLMGFIVKEIDTASNQGVMHPARNKFDYRSPNMNLDFSEGIGAENNTRVRFILKKNSVGFSGAVHIIPKKKGSFFIKAMDGLVLDACAYSIVYSNFANTSYDKIVDFWTSAIQRPLSPDEWKGFAENWHTYYFIRVK